MRLISWGCAALTMAMVTGVAQARDPLTLSATGGGNTVVVNGTNLVDLADNFFNAQKQFAPFVGQDATASLSYGEYPNAITFSRNAAGTSGTVSIPDLGFSKTYNAANSAELQQQVEDDLKQGGLTAYSQFLALVNENTSVGVTDGNPLATTAVMANAGFYRFGFQRPRWDDGTTSAMPKGFDLHFSGGVTSSTEFDGSYFGVGAGTTFAFGDRIGLSITLDALYRDVEGAAVYQLVNTDGVPIVLVKPSEVDGSGLSWVVTPAFVIGVGWSDDLLAGGVPLGGQVTSSLGYRTGNWNFVLANQFGAYNGVGITINDYQFDTDVDQQILKNGAQVIYTFGAAFIDAGVSYTNLLQDAAIEDYWSPQVGIGLRLGDASSIRIGYHGDIGSDFDNTGGDVSLFLSY